ADATGQLLAFETNAGGGCAVARLKTTQTVQGGSVHLSPTLGIAAINPVGNFKTAEGLRVGMSSADMLRIYPGWQLVEGEPNNGGGLAPVAASGIAVYRIALRNGKVESLTLQNAEQNCYE